MDVDLVGFEEEMSRQRERARRQRKETMGVGTADERYQRLIADPGPTEFLGYITTEATATVLAVIEAGEGGLEIFLDGTPFYAEGGGQVGDTGTIATPTGTAEVLDTTYALPGLHRHHARPELLHHLYYTIVQRAQTLGHVSCGPALGGADDAGLADMRATGPGLDHRIAGDVQAGIDPQDARETGTGWRRRGGPVPAHRR